MRDNTFASKTPKLFGAIIATLTKYYNMVGSSSNHGLRNDGGGQGSIGVGIDIGIGLDNK